MVNSMGVSLKITSVGFRIQINGLNWSQNGAEGGELLSVGKIKAFLGNFLIKTSRI